MVDCFSIDYMLTCSLCQQDPDYLSHDKAS
jgi:hypothetical protein